MNLFRAAGLVIGDKPVLPHTPEELLQQARQFKRATGKSLTSFNRWSMTRPPIARNLFTFLMQQNSDFFADPRHIRLQTPEARRVLELFKEIYDEDLTTKNQDYTAATAGFLNGQGGVYLVGTWMIGTYEQASKQPGSPLGRRLLGRAVSATLSGPRRHLCRRPLLGGPKSANEAREDHAPSFACCDSCETMTTSGHGPGICLLTRMSSTASVGARFHTAPKLQSWSTLPSPCLPGCNGNF